MAGNCKPNVVGLEREVRYIVIGVRGSSDSGGSKENSALLNGIAVNEWNSSNVMYWQENDNILDITIKERSNIWRCGTTRWNNYCNELKISKYNDNVWADVTSLYPQTLSSINYLKWEKTISNLPAGRLLIVF